MKEDEPSIPPFYAASASLTARVTPHNAGPLLQAPATPPVFATRLHLFAFAASRSCLLVRTRSKVTPVHAAVGTRV
jgi:hypothetical protein